MFGKRFLPVAFGPGLELGAVPAELVQRHTVTAGVGDSGQMDLDEGTDTDGGRENRSQLFELCVLS